MGVDTKICGLTRPEDAAFAVAHGARYLGVIFVGGPRLVTSMQARAVVEAGGGAPVFGVFGLASVARILEIRDATGIAGAQLHAPGFLPSEVAALQAAGMQVWRTQHLADAGDLDRLHVASQDADAVLVEPRVAGQSGGTGVALDVELAMAARQRLAGRRMVLAGGLTPDTVGERLALVGPDVVDVSSGVEMSPGVKSPERLAAFLEVVRGYTRLA